MYFIKLVLELMFLVAAGMVVLAAMVSFLILPCFRRNVK